MFKNFALKTAARAAAIRLSDKYRIAKYRTSYIDEGGIIGEMRFNQLDDLGSEAQSYIDKNYQVPDSLRSALFWSLKGFSQPNVANMCVVELIAHYDFLSFPPKVQDEVWQIIYRELLKNGVPESQAKFM